MKIVESAESKLRRIVQSELNLEHFCNFVFPPPKAISINQIRTYSGKTLVKGENISSEITIRPNAGTKGCTTTTHDIFLVLIEIWRDRGMPDTLVWCSAREILKRLGLTVGGKSIKALVDEIFNLRRTIIHWKLSFYETEIEDTLNGFDMNILRDAEYLGKKKKIHLVDPETSENPIFSDPNLSIYFRIDDKLRNSMANNRTIPVDVDTRRSITSDRAKCYYGRIDNILCGNKHHYSRTASNLVNDLQMSNVKRYQYKSRREELCIDLVDSLNGLYLSNGNRIKAKYSETVDGQDWKIDFKAQETGRKKPNRKPVNTDPTTINHLALMMSGLVDEKDEPIFKVYAEYLPEQLIYRAVSQFKVDVKLSEVNNKAALFTDLLHKLCHQMNAKWVKDCGADCKNRIQ